MAAKTKNFVNEQFLEHSQLAAIKLHGDQIADMEDVRELEENKEHDNAEDVASLLQRQYNTNSKKRDLYMEVSSSLFAPKNEELSKAIKKISNVARKTAVENQVLGYRIKYRRNGEYGELVENLADSLLGSQTFVKEVERDVLAREEMTKKFHPERVPIRTPQVIKASVLNILNKSTPEHLFGLGDKNENEYRSFVRLVDDIVQEESKKVKEFKQMEKAVGKRKLAEQASKVAPQPKRMNIEGTPVPVVQPIQNTGVVVAEAEKMADVEEEKKGEEEDKKEEEKVGVQSKAKKPIAPYTKTSRKFVPTEKATNIANRVIDQFADTFALSHKEVDMASGVKSRGQKVKEGIQEDDARQSKKDLKFSDGWGETSKASFQKVLNVMKKFGLDAEDRDTKMVDIGSGMGKLLYQAAFDTKKAIIEGIEIDAGRSQAAEIAKNTILERMPLNYAQINRVNLVGKRAIEEQKDLGGATHVFAFSRVMTPETQQNIVQKFAADPNAEFIVINVDPKKFQKMSGAPQEGIKFVGDQILDMVGGKGKFKTYYYYKEKGTSFGSLPPLYKSPAELKKLQEEQQRYQQQQQQEQIRQSTQMIPPSPSPPPPTIINTAPTPPSQPTPPPLTVVTQPEPQPTPISVPAPAPVVLREEEKKQEEKPPQKKADEDSKEDIDAVMKKSNKKRKLKKLTTFNTVRDAVTKVKQRQPRMREEYKENQQMLKTIPDTSAQVTKLKKDIERELAVTKIVVENEQTYIDGTFEQVEALADMNAVSPFDFVKKNKTLIENVEKLQTVQKNSKRINRLLKQQSEGLNSLIDDKNNPTKNAINIITQADVAQHNIAVEKMQNQNMTPEDEKDLDDATMDAKFVSDTAIKQLKQQTGVTTSAIRHTLSQPTVVYPYTQQPSVLNMGTGLLLPPESTQYVMAQAFPGQGFYTQQPTQYPTQQPTQQPQVKQLTPLEQAKAESDRAEQQHRHRMDNMRETFTFANELAKTLKPEQQLVSMFPPSFIASQPNAVGYQPDHITKQQLSGQLPSKGGNATTLVSEVMQVRDAPARVVNADVQYQNETLRLNGNAKNELAEYREKRVKKYQDNVAEIERESATQRPSVRTINSKIRLLEKDLATLRTQLQTEAETQSALPGGDKNISWDTYEFTQKKLKDTIKQKDEQIAYFQDQYNRVESKLTEFDKDKNRDFKNIKDHYDEEARKLKEEHKKAMEELEEKNKQMRKNNEQLELKRNQDKSKLADRIKDERADASSKEQEKRLSESDSHAKAITNMSVQYAKDLGEKQTKIELTQNELTLAKGKAAKYDQFIKKYGADENGNLIMTQPQPEQSKFVKPGRSAQMSLEDDISAYDKLQAEVRVVEMKLQSQQYEVWERSEFHRKQLELAMAKLLQQKEQSQAELAAAKSESEKRVEQAKLDHLNRLAENTQKLQKEQDNTTARLQQEYDNWKRRFDVENVNKQRELDESTRQFNTEIRQDNRKFHETMNKWRDDRKEEIRQFDAKFQIDFMKARKEFTEASLKSQLDFQRLMLDTEAEKHKYEIQQDKARKENERLDRESSARILAEQDKIKAEVDKKKLELEKSEKDLETLKKLNEFKETMQTNAFNYDKLREEQKAELVLAQKRIEEEMKLPALKAQFQHELSKIDYDNRAKMERERVAMKLQAKQEEVKQKYELKRLALNSYHAYNQNLKLHEIKPYIKRVFGMFDGDQLLSQGTDMRMSRAEQLAHAQVANQFMESTVKRSERFDPNEFKNSRLLSTEAEVVNPQTDQSNARRVRLLGEIDKLAVQANEEQKKFRQQYTDPNSLNVARADFASRVDVENFSANRVLLNMQQPLIEVSAHVMRDIDQDEFVDGVALVKLAAISEQIGKILDAENMSQSTQEVYRKQMARITQLKDAALTHNENLGKIFERTLARNRDEVQQRIQKFEIEEERERQRNRLADSAEASIVKHLQRLGLGGNGNPLEQIMGGGSKGGGGGSSSGQQQQYQGRAGRQNYVSERTDQVFGANRNRLGFQFRSSEDQRLWDANEQQVQNQQNQITNKYQNVPGQGKSVSGQYGPSLSVGTSLQKLGTQVAHLTEADVQLMKQLIVDKTTGQAMKTDADGNIVTLSEQEREQAAKIIIEICLFVLSKQVKSVSEQILNKYREQIRENFGDKDEDLIPLLKVANSIANKLSQGVSHGVATERSIKALAGNTFNADNNDDVDMVGSEK